MLAGMSQQVIQVWTWKLHVADRDDEWAALCGTPKPEMLTEEGSSTLPGYVLCEECQRTVDKRSLCDRVPLCDC